MFEKNSTLFPSREKFCFLSHCAVSPLYVGSASAAAGFQNSMVERGLSSLADFADLLPRFRKAYGALLKTAAQNVSFVHTTAEALCQIANGYPFEPGDQIISYLHEYPSNHFPWKIQERRGVELVLLPDNLPGTGNEATGRPVGWSMADLKELCTPRTRVIAVSHVQFTSGYAADLAELGDFCRENSIDLIVDCAQSLGSLPVYPEKFNISAVAASGWKWLMGPKGAAVLYTTPELREKLSPQLAGPGMMKQQFDYLNHSWNPFPDGRLFEYSTLPLDHIAALAIAAEDIFSRYSAEAIRAEIFRLQEIFLDNLDQDRYRVVRFEEKHRSGILSIVPPVEASLIVNKLAHKDIILTERAGYVRVAPHFYIEDEALIQAADALNSLAVP